MARFDPRNHAQNDLEKGWSVDSTRARFDPRLQPVLIRQPDQKLNTSRTKRVFCRQVMLEVQSEMARCAFARAISWSLAGTSRWIPEGLVLLHSCAKRVVYRLRAHAQETRATPKDYKTLDRVA